MSAVLGVVESNWRGRTALVTGASSGIGRAMAVHLASGGCHLVLTARRRERLDELKKTLAKPDVRVDVFPCDLAVSGSATRLINEIHRAGLHVDLLVNNAGVGLHARQPGEHGHGVLRDGGLRRWRRQRVDLRERRGRGRSGAACGGGGGPIGRAGPGQLDRGDAGKLLPTGLVLRVAERIQRGRL